MTPLSQQNPESGSQCFPSGQQTGPLMSAQMRSPEQQMPPRHVSPAKQLLLGGHDREALTHASAPPDCIAQTWFDPQQAPLQHETDGQQTPPQATVPSHPSQQHSPSMQTSSGQQQRSSVGSPVPLLQTAAAAQQNSVPGIGGVVTLVASAKHSAQHAWPHTLRPPAHRHFPLRQRAPRQQSLLRLQCLPTRLHLAAADGDDARTEVADPPIADSSERRDHEGANERMMASNRELCMVPFVETVGRAVLRASIVAFHLTPRVNEIGHPCESHQLTCAGVLGEPEIGARKPAATATPATTEPGRGEESSRQGVGREPARPDPDNGATDSERPRRGDGPRRTRWARGGSPRSSSTIC